MPLLVLNSKVHFPHSSRQFQKFVEALRRTPLLLVLHHQTYTLGYRLGSPYIKWIIHFFKCRIDLLTAKLEINEAWKRMSFVALGVCALVGENTQQGRSEWYLREQKAFPTLVF